MQETIKRLIDIITALVLLVLCMPLLALIALLVRITMGKPVLFRHRRPGLNEKIFTLYKFRTMTEERDEQGNLLPNEERLTRVGRIIRGLSLDELPQLWNVLKGDLSLVGPRPLLVDYLEHYLPEERRRHEVRPGITGLAQVSGRNTMEFADRFKKDIEYIDAWSLWLDLKILFLTAAKVLKRESIEIDERELRKRFEEARRKDSNA